MLTNMKTFITVFLIIASIHACKALQKIAIIGSGPAGLSVASGLKKFMPSSWNGQISIYDSRPNILQTNLGGGVQVSGGCTVLKQLGLYDEFKKIALPIESVVSRDNKLNSLFQLDISKSIRNKQKIELLDPMTKQPIVYSIMRDSLQQLLYNSIQDSDNIQFYSSMQCIQIEELKSSPNKVKLHFKNTNADDNQKRNKVEDYDLVLCCDGINSLGIDYIQKDRSKSISLLTPLLNTINKYTRQYSGVRISYGITHIDNDNKLRSVDKMSTNSFHQFFGDTCYTLLASYGSYEGMRHMIAVIYKDNIENTIDKKYGENAAWNRQNIRKEIEERLESSQLGQIESIRSVLNECDDNRFIDLGVRDRVLPLPYWSSSSHRVILVGDSAHAMPPFFGQGANQALQDAYYISTGLSTMIQQQQTSSSTTSTSTTTTTTTTSTTSNSNNDNINKKLSELIQGYESRRKPFTALLGLKSTVLGRIETLGGPAGMAFRNTFFKVMSGLGVVEESFLDAATPRI